MTKKNILLVEPGYPNKYPPLGLMKIAAYHGPFGRDDNLRFVKGDTPDVLSGVWDRVYVTTLFSFEWKRTSAAIDFALRAARGQAERVLWAASRPPSCSTSSVANPDGRAVRQGPSRPVPSPVA